MATTAPICDFGWKAVDDTLPGTDGRTHRILEHAGPRGLVVVFICNHCPYVKAVIGRIVRDAADLKRFGIGFVAINSNDAAAYPADSFDNMMLFASQHQLGFPYLHDADQNVARTYGAVCTPDFFGFNADMELQYRGRIDGSRKAEGHVDMERELFDAMVRVANSGEGPREQTPSIGCSIKWKDEAA